MSDEDSDLVRQHVTRRRLEYSSADLTEEALADSPIRQFEIWMHDAILARVREPNAMVLATCDPSGQPSSRVVLLRGLDQSGFTFFTNYDSRKAAELESNPRASVTFFWPELERQVRIDGTVARTSAAESDEYFRGRPVDSRLGAWASPQSRTIPDRNWLEARVAALRDAPDGGEKGRPPNWGGYRLTPHAMEFWQGRPSRLHDRLRFRRSCLADRWVVERLAP